MCMPSNSKMLGVMMWIDGAGNNPRLMGFRKIIVDFGAEVGSNRTTCQECQGSDILLASEPASSRITLIDEGERFPSNAIHLGLPR